MVVARNTKGKISGKGINIFYVFLLVFILISSLSHAGETFFSTLSMRDGLPSNIIAGMTQDRYGFLWIGTASGLARYDGNHLTVFKKSLEDNSLPSNELTTVLADGDMVWVGTWGGLCSINVRTFEVTRVDLGIHSTIRTLRKATDGTLWIGTGNGLLHYSTIDHTYKVYTAENSGLSHDVIRAIYEDRHGTLWIGTYDGLNRMTENGTFVPVELKQGYHPTIKNHLILDIQPSYSQEDDYLWIGTETGLYKLNTTDLSFNHFTETNSSFSNEVIKSIYVKDKDELWLGTDFGLNVFHPGQSATEVYYHNPKLSYSIANNVIWQVFEDQGGVIWLVTSNGLSRINKFGNFYEYHEISYRVKDQLIGNQVKSFLVTRSGKFWLATQNGVLRIDPLTREEKIFDTTLPEDERILINNVFALEEDQYGQIWIGTAAGINIWNEETGQMSAITSGTHKGLTSNYIGNFTQTSSGEMWVSAWEGGIYKISGDLRNTQSLTFQRVHGIHSGSEKDVFGNNYLWVIEYDELYRIDPHTLEVSHITAFREAALKQMINCLYFSEEGELWAGAQHGLLRFDPSTGKADFHPLPNIGEAAASSIIEDNAHHIWIASNKMMYEYFPDNNDITMYPLDDNMPLKSFYYGCAARSPAGELFFGGDNGYISFDPLQAKVNSYQPPIYLTSVKVNNKELNSTEDHDSPRITQDISFTSNLVLNYDQRSVTFEFSSLHFWQPELNRYAYMLEGLDKEWNYVTGNKNFAVYSNLPAGHYTFRVKGTNNYGLESQNAAIMDITIHPPLLLRPFFIVLYVLLLILLIYYGLKIYATRVHLKNELRIIKMEKDHAVEIEKTKEQFFTNISHELRTPISLILPPIHEIQKKGQLNAENQQLLSLAEKNSNRLLRLVNQILDFKNIDSGAVQLNIVNVELVGFCKNVFTLFSDQAHRKSIIYRFNTTIGFQNGWIDSDKMETVLFNLLSNAFKFTGEGGKINMELLIRDCLPDYKDGVLEIRVADTGIGIPKRDLARIFERFYQSEEGKKVKESSGIGLTLAAEYIHLHHGTIRVESQSGDGTSFILQLPLGKRHLAEEPSEMVASRNPLLTHTFADNHPGNPDHEEKHKPVVLLVEDNMDMIDFVLASLKDEYTMITASNGEDGLKKAEKYSPQVIISDIMMPVMDGLLMSQRLKSNPGTSHISIILLTARSLPSQQAKGIRTGADVYITKPFEIDLLKAHLEQLIARKIELEEYFRHDLIRITKEDASDRNEDRLFLKGVMGIIEANITDPHFGVEMISDELGMSSTHLYRKLKSLTDFSAKDIIKKYRLKKASLLLKNKEGNITDVMYDTGFSNLSYFSKCFRSEFGCTPKEYQRQKNDTHFDIEEDVF